MLRGSNNRTLALVRHRVLLQSRHSLPSCRLVSTRPQGGLRVSAPVAAFSILLVPVAALTIYAGRYGPTDEALEERIRERYPEETKTVAAKNQHMAAFFQKAVFNNHDEEVQEKLDSLLRAGSGDVKRLHAVDENLFGTEEGLVEKQRTLEAMEEEKKKLKRKKRRKKQNIQQDEPALEKVEKKEEKKKQGFTMPHVAAQSVATVAVVATVAAAVGFMAAGGGRRS